MQRIGATAKHASVILLAIALLMLFCVLYTVTDLQQFEHTVIPSSCSNVSANVLLPSLQPHTSVQIHQKECNCTKCDTHTPAMAQEAAASPPRAFSAEEARECLRGSNLWFLGNSVSRHLFVAMYNFLKGDEKDACDTGYRANEQTNCAHHKICKEAIPSHNIHLDFTWQQRIHHKEVEALFERATVNGGIRQIVVSNAGLDDIVLNAFEESKGGRNPNQVWQPSMTAWRELCRVQVPQLTRALEAWFFKAPFARFVWRTTTAVCGKDNWTLQKDEANSQIAYSNEMIRSALEALKHKLVQGPEAAKWLLPRMQAYVAKHVASGSQVEWTDHSPSQALQILHMFESTRQQCDAYDDHVHHCKLGRDHVQGLIRKLCPVNLRQGYPSEWPQELLNM